MTLSLALTASACSEDATRPMGLQCDDSGPCGSNNSGSQGGGGGGGGGGGSDAGFTDGGALINVNGTVLGVTSVPVGPSTGTVPLSAWTISSVQDPSLAAASVANGTFSLAGIPTVTLTGTGQSYYGLLAAAPPGDYFGSYRAYSATATTPLIQAVTVTTLQSALFMAGGATPDSALGQIIVNLRSSADSTAQGVANVLVTSGSALTFYDSSATPGQLSVTSTGSGPAGFALILNVPGSTTGTPITLSLQSSTTGVTVSPSSVQTLAFSRTVTWVDVVATTSGTPVSP